MPRNPLLIVTLSSLLVGLLVFSFTPDLSHFMGEYFLPKESRDLEPEVAQFSQIEGRVWRRHRGKTRDSRLRKSGTIYHQDQITIERRSSAEIKFPDGSIIKLSEKTKAIIEYWNPADSNSPVYLNILIGDFELVTAGTPGKLYVVQDRQLFTPSHRPQKGFYILTLKNSEIKIAREEKSPTPQQEPPLPGELQDDEPTEEIPREVSPPAQVDGEPLNSLTNKYIEEIIGLQKPQFQKCQANAIRESGPVKGQVLIGFTIQSRGKIEDAKILQTNVNNPQLLDCLVSVFKTAKFQEFKGEPIIRSYPLAFE